MGLIVDNLSRPRASLEAQDGDWRVLATIATGRVLGL